MLTASTCFCARPERKCTHPRNKMLFDSAYKSFYLGEAGVGGGERICSLKSAHRFDCSVRNAFSDDQRVCGLRMSSKTKVRTGFGIFTSRSLSFSCFPFLLLPLFWSKPSVPLFARGLWVCTVCVMVECGQGWVSENVLVDLSQASRGLGESGFFVLCWWKAALDPISLSLTSGHFTSSQFTMIILNPGPNYFSLP